MLYWQSVASFFIIFFGYNIMSLGLRAYYYQNSDPKKPNDLFWKTQPQNKKNVGPQSPLFAHWFKEGRASDHHILASINLLLASLAMVFTTQMIMMGKTKMYWTTEGRSFFELLFISTVLPVVWQCVIEYFWHRMMHLPWFYKRFHKLHHYYKSPEPFDDMYIHPLEAFGYYCILYSPPFVIPMHFYSFVFYMVLMGLTGILDHCGIIVRIPGVYDTSHHDLHHLKTHCNYSFPFVHLDILFRTFEGEFMGFHYSKPCRAKELTK
eukprot:TRINITY_DN13679_c0_g1_i1.p1 TRINITY_DN13679_c0_g1~~TRINITY_DN13679_c0_g1_i1.p1  ORF type:complete len:265 (-),score=-6.77 TRINITY_DN13679_c0_g1_i1:8-802(-)